MNEVQKITEFVEQVFDLYQVNKYEFFFTYDERTQEEIPLDLFPTGRIDDETLKRISVRLGLSAKAILTMDMAEAKKYWNKYPFFKLYHEYMGSWSWYQHFTDKKPTAAEMLLNAIFAEEKGIRGTPRYDMKNLTERLITKLKEIDQAIPGTYHNGAEITQLRVYTQVFFSFPQCAELLRSFISMVKRTEELFFQALRQELNEEDASELNFLASWLDAVDAVAPTTVITYGNVRALKEVYLEENLPDFFSYVKIRSFIGTNPWRCQEFFDNMEIVKEFLYIFPQAKADMRKFAHDVAKFSCTFVWSDAEPIKFSDEDELMLEDFDRIIGENPIPVEERAKEVTHIYVDKTPAEMQGWDAFAQTVKIASGPVSKGGIAVPARQYISGFDAATMKRIQSRVAAKRGGNRNG